MATDILTISVNHAADPDGAQLQTLLAAELAYERARSTRQRWLGITVCAALLALIIRTLGIDTVPPSWVLVAAAALALRTALAALVEHQRHRRWSAALSQHPGAVLRSPPEL